MKQFDGQYSDEKLLLKKHENKISFTLKKFYILIINIILGLLFGSLSYYFIQSNIIFSSIFIVFFVFGILYLKIIYQNTWVIITSRRILKLVRTGLFASHKKELKLTDIKATLASRNGILGAIFGYGNITIQGTEEHSNIYFKGMNNYSDITNYIGRILDYIKINGHTDDLSSYKTKKERKN